VQTMAPPVENCPGLQGPEQADVVSPVVPPNLPAGQLSQAGVPPGEYCPVGHRLHPVAPEELYVPAAHGPPHVGEE
jgi:hypothetical protein